MKATKAQPYSVFVNYDASAAGKRFLLLSDIHWDNPHCDRVLLKKHLEYARTNNAGVFIFGDLFCAMQGKYDPRGGKESIRPEHNVVNYLDAIVEDCAAYFEPYKDNLLLVTPGNHETSILKRMETDLIGRFAKIVGCETATYQGWITFRASIKSGQTKTVMSYHHGYGGGGPVTKDVIQASRKAVYLPDADIVVSGHTHDRNIFPIQRARFNTLTGEQSLKEQLHLKLGTYKDEYTAGAGWATEKGHPPKSLGGIEIVLKRMKSVFNNNHIEYTAHLL